MQLLLTFSLISLAVFQVPQSQPNIVPKVKASPNSNEAMKSQLLKIRDEDQDFINIHGRPWSIDTEKAWAEMHRRHETVVRDILSEHGWPSSKDVGKPACGHIWLVLQHSSPTTIKEFLPLMEKAVERGDLPPDLVAMTKDRVLVNEGKKQIYGTQFQPGDEVIPMPIEDEANVDKRRAAVGLPPLQEFIQEIRAQFPPPKK